MGANGRETMSEELRKAKALYDEIPIAMSQHDDEVAHAREDALREHALRCFMGAHPDAHEIGAIAISTSKLRFARWCS
jgi:hypothetical protein